MKALNRAIARTTSQIARYHQPGANFTMVAALEQHLAALLEMERKQLETAGMKFATLTGDGTGEALPGLAQHLRTALRPFSSPLIVADRFATKMPVQEWAQQTVAGISSKPAEQEPPSLPLWQWMAGDKIFFVASEGWGFSRGKAYEIIHINMLNGFVTIKDDAGNEREFGPGPLLNASFKNYSRRTDEQADVEANADKVQVEPGLHIEVGDVLTRTSGGQFGVWTFGADYTVMAVAADGDVTVYDDSHYPRVMSAGAVRSNFSVGKKQVEPAEQAQPAPDATPAPAYQVGDMLEYAGESGEYFTKGKLYPVSAVSTSRQYPVYIIDDEGDEHGLRKCLPEFINRGQPAAQPAPDVIDMTDPRNWQAGDVVLRSSGEDSNHFKRGQQYVVAETSISRVQVFSSQTATLGFDFHTAAKYFTWLRHGEAQQ